MISRMLKSIEEGSGNINNYYIFISLDGVPIVELLLNSKYRAIEKYDNTDLNTMKYIILNFKTDIQNKDVIKKGYIKQHEKILTKQITYLEIDIQMSYQNMKENKKEKFSKKEWELLLFTKKLFFGTPIEFIEYIEKKHLFSKHDLINLKKAMKKMSSEQKILDSWNLLNK